MSTIVHPIDLISKSMISYCNKKSWVHDKLLFLSVGCVCQLYSKINTSMNKYDTCTQNWWQWDKSELNNILPQMNTHIYIANIICNYYIALENVLIHKDPVWRPSAPVTQIIGCPHRMAHQHFKYGPSSLHDGDIQI